MDRQLLLALRCVCICSQPNVFALISMLNKDLNLIRSDNEVLNNILYNLNIHERANNFTQFLAVLDDNLFTSPISSDCRQLVAVGKSILINDIPTVLSIIREEYGCEKDIFLFPYVLDYLTAYTLMVDDSLEWMFKHGLIDESDDVDIFSLVEVRPPGWEYVTSKKLLEKGDIADEILIKLISNRDYGAVRDLYDKIKNLVDGFPWKHIIASNNKEIYDNPSLLGLPLDLEEVRDNLENHVNLMCYCQDATLLQEMFDIGVISAYDSEFIYPSRNTEVFLWKLRLEMSESALSTNILDLPGILDFRHNNESIEEYMRFIDQLSKIFKKTTAGIFAKICYAFDPYDARELYKLYKGQTTQRMKVNIRSSNPYEDREYNQLLED